MDNWDITSIIFIIVMATLVSLLITGVVFVGNAMNTCKKECEERDLQFQAIRDRGFFDFYCYCEEKNNMIFKMGEEK